MEETPADRLRVALGLHGLGVEMYRQRQRREHPDWDEQRVETAVCDWLAGEPLDGTPSPPERRHRVMQLVEQRRRLDRR